MLLRTLIASHKGELLRRSRAKLESNLASRAGAVELDYWLPVLLDLIAEVLDAEEEWELHEAPDGAESAGRARASDAAVQHQLRKLGITLERVSDDCAALQNAITELAFEEHSSLNAAQYRALDRSVARVLAGAYAGYESLRERVVVVDTDRQARRLVEQFAGDIYLIEFHDDGAAAIARVRSEAPSLLITEILLPRLDGLTLCRTLKKDSATAHVPILVYSVLLAEQRARRSGADAFLEKPLERTRLVASMRELTASGPSPLQDAAE